MKLPEKLKPGQLLGKDKKGVALVTVLTVMALTTILVLTFFSLASSEHRASFTYSNGLQAQQVGEQAVNMVIAQIREATTVGTKTAWASQPGAIRQWEENGDEGLAYKLYSDDTLKTREWADFKADFDDASNWSAKPAHFVDLNEPVIRGDKVYYPIVHPLAATVPEWPEKLGDEKDQDGVEGFSYNEGSNKLLVQGNIGALAEKKFGHKHLAMPVKWIYQLADGTLGYLAEDGSSSSGHAFIPMQTDGSRPSAENPIAARFAFWADDETTKLNVNTHAGGLAWDTPKTGGILDMNMGKHQPAQHEWQRYPGHPASTHLSPALAPGVLDIVNDRDAMEMLFEVVPRVVGGGSESGTRPIDTRDPKENNGLIADSEPLFPTLDDVIMRSDREPHQFPDAQGAPVPPNELSEYLERSKFFVTVNSRAPETTMFNTPKIAIWPIFNAPYNTTAYDQKLSVFDRLIHYCASIGALENPPATVYPRFEYIFKREKADSATHDYKNIDRNKVLYGYLRNMLSRPIPGYGGSFVDKYGKEETAQIATMIFDYIRTTNLHDDTLYDNFEEAFTSENTDNHRSFTNPRDLNEPGFGHKGHGQVTPISIQVEGIDNEESHGIGRFFTLAGAHVHVTCVAQPQEESGTYTLYPGLYDDRGTQLENPDGILYTNLPPLPGTVDLNDESTYPESLKALKDSDPLQYNAARQPQNWNWQLAFLDDEYRKRVLADPTANKFNRGAIAGTWDDMRLKSGEKLVQAAFMFNLFSPSIGWGSINPDMEIKIKREDGMIFRDAGGDPVGFLGFEGGAYGASYDGYEGDNTFTWATNWAKPHKQGGARSWGGLLSFGYTVSARQPLQINQRQIWHQLYQDGVYDYVTDGYQKPSGPPLSRLTPIDRGYYEIKDQFSKLGRNYEGTIGNSASDIARAYQYDLVTVPFKVPTTNGVDFGGGTVNFKIYDKGAHTEGSSPDTSPDAPDEQKLVQDVTLEFGGFGFNTPPMPTGSPGRLNEFNALGQDSNNAVEIASLTAEAANNIPTVDAKASMKTGQGTGRGNNSARMHGRLSFLATHWDSGSTYVRGEDIVQSVGIAHGDARIGAATKFIPWDSNDGYFAEHPDYGVSPKAHRLVNSGGHAIHGFSPANSREYLIIPDLPDTPYTNSGDAAIPLPFLSEKSEDVQRYGDFDNGAGTMIDGPYINKPDEGNVHGLRTKMFQPVRDIWESKKNRGDFPYFSSPDLAEAGGPAYFSPNRIVSGPGMFGSIPTGVKANDPWQTLLFRPNVQGGRYDDHPGRPGGRGSLAPPGGEASKLPPDHVIMEMFWMPVVEPYAISEPLSTGGKINLNYQIVPFLHVNRSTALRGVFRSEMMVCIPNKHHRNYKHNYGRGEGYHWQRNPYGGAIQELRLRAVIVEHSTMEQFWDRFDNGRNLFKSSSEICEVHLIPTEVSERMNEKRGRIGTETPTMEKMKDASYWEDHSLVGDNSRERPYTNIQTRVTTKSNTYLVHYRAQVLKQSRREEDGDYAFWRPEVDSVQAEYRGSSMVERYVDPNSKDIVDYADLFGGPTPIEDKTIDKFYQYRVVNPKRFAP